MYKLQLQYLILILRSYLNIQFNSVISEMFDSIKIARTKTLKI